MTQAIDPWGQQRMLEQLEQQQATAQAAPPPPPQQQAAPPPAEPPKNEPSAEQKQMGAALQSAAARMPQQQQQDPFAVFYTAPMGQIQVTGRPSLTMSDRRAKTNVRPAKTPLRAFLEAWEQQGGDPW